MTPISAPHGHHLTQALNHSEVGASRCLPGPEAGACTQSRFPLLSHIGWVLFTVPGSNLGKGRELVAFRHLKWDHSTRGQEALGWREQNSGANWRLSK